MKFLYSIYCILTILFFSSCKKDDVADNSSKSMFITKIFNSDGSYYVNDTFELKYITDFAVETQVSYGYNYYGQDAYSNYTEPIFNLKNKIAVQNYNNCTDNISNSSDYNIIFRQGGSWIQYAQSGTLSITSVAQGVEWLGLARGTKVSGKWTGVVRVINDNTGLDTQKQGEFIINNVLFQN